MRRSGGIFDIEGTRRKVEDLEQQTTLTSFWEDNVRAQRVLKEKGQLERVLKDYDALVEGKDDVLTLLEMAQEMEDEETAAEASALFNKVLDDVRGLETRRLLSAEEDAMNAIVEINAGAGGTESHHASMTRTRRTSVNVKRPRREK